MAYTVRWSPEAVDDAEAIAAWINNDSPQHASSVVDKLVQAVAGLADHPLRGRIVPEFADPAYREVFVYSYRIIYKVGTESVNILAIVHGRRLLSQTPD
ncbi:addiction module RelE/StbE family toxin [Natronocella acetinitrilica]|uniref:Addiction module RelE/StbE family toxin n=1 Tax=Natronocella acetinitrilica TaxID=414046 RepID=A0AAE3KA43_9GAMM|nr:type II toxin-antitoxin system RelE/ParE family toxin [Natronocella acetinitrilica]MCP1672936.1 addiction module RelE/StbE family toxin [Natronocella acetinitrilica]